MKKNILSLLIAFFLINALFTMSAYGKNLDLNIPPGGGRVYIELITSEAAFNNTLSLVSPNNVGISAKGCNLEPAVGSIGLNILSEKKSQHGCRVELDYNPATPDITDPFPEGPATLEFSMCAKVALGDACSYNWSSDPNKNYDNLDHVIKRDLAPGAYELDWEDWPYGGDRDYDDINVTVRVNGDKDGDGLWDDWETSGIDTNGDGTSDLDLAVDENNNGVIDPGEHANSSRKDIFLQIDYMECNSTNPGDCTSTNYHSHRPKQNLTDPTKDVIKIVKKAFADKGTILHVDVKNAIDHKNILGFSTTGRSEFDDVKDKYFGANNPRRFAYHYALFAHRLDDTLTSGRGETSGNDFIVSLGDWNTICIFPNFNGNNILQTPNVTDDLILRNNDGVLGDIITTGPDLYCDTTTPIGDDTAPWQPPYNPPSNPVNIPISDIDNDNTDDRNVGTVLQQAGTLMHELGHNLNLTHGGNDDFNAKPNYISVMNKYFQTGIPRGIPTQTLEIDYSNQVLATLNENSLNEFIGLGAQIDYTKYYCPGKRTPKQNISKGSMDWNCNNVIDTTNVPADINFDGTFTIPKYRELKGFDDWVNLKYTFQSSNNFEDGVRFLPDIPELDYTTYLTISNKPPVSVPGGPYTGDEGSMITFDGSGSIDPDKGDGIVTYEWDFGDGSTFTGSNPTHTYADNGSYTATLTVTDTYGAANTASTTVNVNNIAPTVGPITAPIAPVLVGTLIAASAPFTDPGIQDTHTALWDWDDGTSSAGTVTEAGGSGSVTDSHTYTKAGIYTINLTITDKDGGAGSAIYRYVVVYDPNGGFVTGGGWIDSPEGGYVPDPSLTGRANFGFVSKYQKGATVPIGETEFQFRVADLDFHSTSYDWLVIAGARAQYKGKGTINGTGDYGFLLTATDGQVTGGGGIDKFRIKIWDIVTESLIYDNAPGSDDIDSSTLQNINGGSIMIHKT